MTRFQIEFDCPVPKFSVDHRTLGFTKAESDGEEDVFNVNGVIGDAWEGLTSHQMVPLIQDSSKPLRFRMNTPGGFVHDALDIYDAMINHPHKVTVDIVAMAWSAGTILSAGADETRIAPAAKYGLHRCWSGIVNMGNAEEMELGIKQQHQMVESLRKLDVQLAQMIADRTGATFKQVQDWMIGPEGCDGTEFVGSDAVDAKLVDGIIETTPKKQEMTSLDVPAARMGGQLDVQIRAQRQMLAIFKGRAGIS